MLGLIALSGALTTAILGSVATPLAVVGAVYVVLTLLAAARGAYPELSRRLSWPGEQTYQLLRRGAWALTAAFAALTAVAWMLGAPAIGPLIWTVSIATFAVATQQQRYPPHRPPRLHDRRSRKVTIRSGQP